MRFFGAILAVFFVACGGLSPLAENILLLSEKPNDCKMLESAKGAIVDVSGAMSDAAMKEKAMNYLRERSVKVDGDALLILSAEKKWDYALGGWEMEIKGEIYKCAGDLAENEIDSALETKNLQ
ncbi:hypothetical protein ACWIUD_01915 [Helicobacter sp. 23-1044]